MDSPIGETPRTRTKVDKRAKLTTKYYRARPIRKGDLSVLKIPKEVYGDQEVCFITVPGHGTRLFRGRVCGQLSDPGVTGTYYVIKLDNFTWPYFEIRDSSLMSEDDAGIVPAVEAMFNPDLDTTVALEYQDADDNVPRAEPLPGRDDHSHP